MNYFLSVVLPIFNEQNRIKKTLNKIISYLKVKDFSFELILVNDGSSDNTLNIMEKYKRSILNNFEKIDFRIIDNKNNFGKGYSVKVGVLASSGDNVLFTDADLSTPIEELDILFDSISNGYNIAIASRDLPGSNIVQRQNIIRESMGKLFNLFVRKIMNFNYRDTQCGFKLFDRKAVNMIFPKLKINDFSFDVEILYIAEKLGLKVKEVPVTWNNSKDSKVRVIQDSLKMFFSLIKIKRIHRKLSKLTAETSV